MRQSSDEEQQCPPTVSHDHAASRLVKSNDNSRKNDSCRSRPGHLVSFGSFSSVTNDRILILAKLQISISKTIER